MVTAVNDDGTVDVAAHGIVYNSVAPSELGAEVPAGTAGRVRAALASTPGRNQWSEESIRIRNEATPDERLALAMYATGDVSNSSKGTDAFTAARINSALRNGDDSDPDIAKLDSALARGRFQTLGGLPEGMVYRTVPSSALEGLVKGSVYVDPAYVSTATDPLEMESIKSIVDNPVRLTIIVPKGYPGAPTGVGYDLPGSEFRQSEWVLPRGTRFRVLSKGAKNVVVEVVPDDAPADAPVMV